MSDDPGAEDTELQEGAEPPSEPAEAPEPAEAEPAEAESAGDDEGPKRSRGIERQFTALKRQQKAHKAERTEFERARAEFEGQRQQFAQQAESLRRAQQMAAEQPDEWLRQGGLDRAKLEAHWKQPQSGQHDPRMDAGVREMAALKAELQRRDERLQRLEAAHNQEAETRYVADLTAKVQAAGERFDLINEFGAHRSVAEYQALVKEKTGQYPSWEDAAVAIEACLEKQHGDTMKKVLANPKLAKRFGWQPALTEQSQSGDTESEGEAQTAKPTRTVKAPAAPKRKHAAGAPQAPAEDADALLERTWREKMAQRGITAM